jgi:hypothetical protein
MIKTNPLLKKKHGNTLTIIDHLFDAALVVDEVFALLPLFLAVSCQDRLRPDVRRLPARAEIIKIGVLF